MTAALLITTLVLFSCIVGSRLSHKIGIPALFIFMVLGMLFGSDGFLKIPFDNYAFAQDICSVALIFIMFYGGFGTRWSEAKPVAVPALALSSLGVVLTAAVTGLFCVYVCGMEFWEGMLVGCVLSSTDAASVFSILRSKKLSLKDHTASLLELESGSNDPFAYMLMVLVLSIKGGKASAGALGLEVLAQIGFGLAVGAIVAVVAVYVLRHMAFSAMGLHTIYVFTVALFAYAAAAQLGGNGYLSVYVAGIIMGNSRLPHQKVLVGFFDAFTGLMQMLLFFLLGLLAFPSRMVPVLLPSLAIAVFLTVVARPLAVGLILLPLRRSIPQFLLVSWAGLRGAASIVFAIMALVTGDGTQSDIVHIVFCVVLFSIVLPLSKAILAVMVLYYGVGVWNGWFWASAILRDREMYPLQLVLREILLQNSTSNMTGGTSVGDVESVAATVKYATIMVATVPILCIYPFLQKYFAAGVMVGAVKE